MSDLTFDTAGNLYIVESARIRGVSPDGMIRTVAGTGKYESSGDGGLAIQAGIWPQHIAVDSDGSIYFAESSFNRIRRITPDGYIHTVAGTGAPGSLGLGGMATAAQLSNPGDVALDAGHNLYIADRLNSRIVKVSPDGLATLFAGNVFVVESVAIGSDGSLYSGAFGQGLTRWDGQGNIVEHFGDFDGSLLKAGPAGVIYNYSNGLRQLYRLDPGSQTPVLVPVGRIDAFAVAPDGSLYTSNNGLVVRVGPSGSTAIAGITFGSRNLAVDNAGDVYVASNPIRKLNLATGVSTVIAGTGESGFSGDGGPAKNAQLSSGGPIAVTPLGELYFYDGTRVRHVDRAGMITTVAGIDGYGYNGDNIPATQAALGYGLGIAVSPSGDLYLSDYLNHRIRRVDVRGIITTVVGTGVSGWSGDGGPAAAAQIERPGPIVFDARGNLYIADSFGERIRKVTPAGTITTVARDLPTFVGGMTIDADGYLYLTNSMSCIVTRVTPAGTAETIAGTGICGLEGDAGPALFAGLLEPFDIGVAPDGTLLFADGRNGQYLRKLEPANIFPRTVVNAASWRNNNLAPGELVTLYWTGLAAPPAESAAVTGGYFPTILADTQVLFDGVPAPMIYIDSSQINTVVPYSVAGRTATGIQVISGGKASNQIGMPVQAASPGLFAIVNQDYSRNGPQNPAARGLALVLFGTGAGQASPAGDGLVTPGAGTLGLPVTIRIDDIPATVEYAGPAPGLISGAFQINVRIPAAARTGAVPLSLVIGETPAESGLQVVLQ